MSDGLIYQQLAKVMHEVGAVPKDRTGDGVRYKFQGVADILAKAQPAFAAQGVVMVPHRIVHHHQQDRETRNGGLQVQADLLVQWRFYASDGSFVEAETFGHSFDTSDKAFNKAMTASLKYALKQVLAIPEDADDQDAERPDTGRVVVRRPEPEPDGLTKATAKKWLVQEFLGKGYSQDEAKADAGRVWAETGLDRANPWTPDKLRDALTSWVAGAEPFGEDPPAGVDAETGEVAS